MTTMITAAVLAALALLRVNLTRQFLSLVSCTAVGWLLYRAFVSALGIDLTFGALIGLGESRDHLLAVTYGCRW